MTATKLKPAEQIGEDLPILTFQTQRIMKNCAYQVDTKNEYVQWVTGDKTRTSLKSITQAQAKKIIRQQEGIEDPKPVVENWAYFDKNNKKHLVVLSLLHQMFWTVKTEKGIDVPDLDRLSNFLKSDKSPVKKKLSLMDDIELEKVITALKGIVKSRWK